MCVSPETPYKNAIYPKKLRNGVWGPRVEYAGLLRTAFGLRNKRHMRPVMFHGDGFFFGLQASALANFMQRLEGLECLGVRFLTAADFFRCASLEWPSRSSRGLSGA